MADYTIHVPQGFPDEIRLASTNLKTIAGDLDDNARSVRGEAMAMVDAWSDHNGKAAYKEAVNLAAGGEEYASHINEGANALRHFARALETAQTEIKKCHADKEAAYSAARDEARAATPSFDLMSATDQAVILDGYVAEKMRSIMAQYQDARDRLQKAERTCKADLTDAIPGYQDGMSAKKIASIILAKNLEKLPGAMQEYNAATNRRTAAHQEEFHCATFGTSVLRQGS